MTELTAKMDGARVGWYLLYRSQPQVVDEEKMAYSQASLALELYRPTIGRYAPILFAFCFVAALWVAVDAGIHSPLVVNESAREATAAVEPATIKSGELDVPAYYFPDAATGTDRFVDVRPSDCGGSSR